MNQYKNDLFLITYGEFLPEDTVMKTKSVPIQKCEFNMLRIQLSEAVM